MNTQLNGIDVSHYQGQVDWSAVAAHGASFAMIKASQGTSYTDPMFSTNWTGANAAAVKTGAYHYFMPSESFLDQADLLISQLTAVDYRPGRDLPPAIDCEEMDGVGSSAFVFALSHLVELVRRKYNVHPLIYTSPDFWIEQVGNPDFSSCPLWIADYTGAAQPNLPSTWKSYAIWQCSQTGTVPGIEGHVDLDRSGPGYSSLTGWRMPLDWF